MAFITIVIEAPQDTLPTANYKTQNPGNVPETLNLLVDYIAAIAGGNRPASVQVVSRATNPSVTTDADPNSISNTYNHL